MGCELGRSRAVALLKRISLPTLDPLELSCTAYYNKAFSISILNSFTTANHNSRKLATEHSVYEYAGDSLIDYFQSIDQAEQPFPSFHKSISQK